MNNMTGTGKQMTFTAPGGGVTAGGGLLIGALFVVAASTVAAGLPFACAVEGVFTLPKNAGEGNLVEGQPVSWDVANNRFSTDQSVGLPIGTMAAAALSADVTGSVRLHGVSLAGRQLTVRKRLTIAQINAGATLVPALPGIAIRMTSSKAIAIGGAAAAVTTVDVIGTQGAAPVKLVAYAQASLTESTVLTSGGAGAAVLADGASYLANDRGTAITAGHTGAAITTAVDIDFEVNYTLE